MASCDERQTGKFPTETRHSPLGGSVRAVLDVTVVGPRVTVCGSRDKEGRAEKTSARDLD